MKIKIYTSTYFPTIRKYSNIAIKNYLWADWGLIVTWYDNPSSIAAIAIAYHEETPVGAAALKNYIDYKYNFGVFVNQHFRRNGIGTKLVKAIQKRDCRKLYIDNVGSIRRPFFGQFGL